MRTAASDRRVTWPTVTIVLSAHLITSGTVEAGVPDEARLDASSSSATVEPSSDEDAPLPLGFGLSDQFSGAAIEPSSNGDAPLPLGFGLSEYQLMTNSHADLFRRSYEAEVGYDEFRFKHAERAFQQQYWVTWITFVVVLSLVLLGMYFSWVQFNAGQNAIVKVKPTEAATATQPTDDPSAVATPTAEVNATIVHHLEISKMGLKLSSPVLGVIILVVSLGFFYLYLDGVYPLQDLARTPAASAETNK